MALCKEWELPEHALDKPHKAASTGVRGKNRGGPLASHRIRWIIL